VGLLRELKSLKYLKICDNRKFSTNASLTLTTNGISALAEFPNLTGLRLVCCGRESKHLASALPTLTRLESLSLVQDSYGPNDAVYLARLTNLVVLEITGRIPQTQPELQSLATLVHLRKLQICGSNESIQNLLTNKMPRFTRLNTLVISPDWQTYEASSSWDKPAK
jgi:hypothetical protein